MLLADVADAVADSLAKVDPEHADDYAANAAALRADLERSTGLRRTGLASCERGTVVVSHDAFGYLAKYGLDDRAHRRPLPRRRTDTGRPGPAAAT